MEQGVPTWLRALVSAKGLSGWRIVKDHAMRNAMIPILGGLPTASGLTISNLIVIEYLANIGGMGRMLGFEFINHNAVPNLIVSVVICLAAVFVLIDGLVDIALFWLDPKAGQARREALAARRANRYAWWRNLPARLSSQAGVLRAWFASLGETRPPRPRLRPPGCSCCTWRSWCCWAGPGWPSRSG